MHIKATLKNSEDHNEIQVWTASNAKQINIPARPDGKGSLVNGGELLFLALATCFCNDLYREAAKRKIKINSVEVEVSGEFGAEGEPGFNIQYRAKINADATEHEV